MSGKTVLFYQKYTKAVLLYIAPISAIMRPDKHVQYSALSASHSANVQPLLYHLMGL